MFISVDNTDETQIDMHAAATLVGCGGPQEEKKKNKSVNIQILHLLINWRCLKQA